MLEFIMSPFGLLIIAYLGMFTHFLKKKVRGESVTEIKKYFQDHFKSTFISAVATGIGFTIYFTAMLSGTMADIGIIFGIGFMSDSFFNKYEAPEPEKVETPAEVKAE